MRIAIVGVGFLGSLFSIETAKRAFALKQPLRFRVYDPGDIETRNVANQAYSPTDVGKQKAATVASMLRRYGPFVRASGLVSKLDDEARLKTDFIVCAVDNVTSRNAMWLLATRLSVPLLSLGVDQAGGGDVSWYVPDRPIDDVPFSPIKGLVGPPVNEQVESLPPCELIGFRDIGHIVAVTGARALFMALGYDPEKYMGDKFPALGGFSKWHWKGHHFEFGGLVT